MSEVLESHESIPLVINVDKRLGRWIENLEVDSSRLNQLYGEFGKTSPMTESSIDQNAPLVINFHANISYNRLFKTIIAGTYRLRWYKRINGMPNADIDLFVGSHILGVLSERKEGPDSETLPEIDSKVSEAISQTIYHETSHSNDEGAHILKDLSVFRAMNYVRKEQKETAKTEEFQQAKHEIIKEKKKMARAARLGSTVAGALIGGIVAGGEALTGTLDKPTGIGLPLIIGLLAYAERQRYKKRDSRYKLRDLHYRLSPLELRAESDVKRLRHIGRICTVKLKPTTLTDAEPLPVRKSWIR